MPLVPFETLPADSRLWVFGVERSLAEAEQESFLSAVDLFLETWVAHGVPLTCGRDWRWGRFLLVAVDEASAPPSGCSIDAMVGVLRDQEHRLGVRVLDNTQVWFVADGEVQQLSRSEFARLAEEVPSARYLKLEDPPTPTKIRAIRELIGDRMGIFGGLGGVFLLDELAQGSAGAMTGFTYPEILVEVCRHMAEGDRAKAEEVFHRYLPLILFESQEGIGLAIRKEALHHRGLISTPRVRHPGGPVADLTRKELLHLIDTLGL